MKLVANHKFSDLSIEPYTPFLWGLKSGLVEDRGLQSIMGQYK